MNNNLLIAVAFVVVLSAGVFFINPSSPQQDQVKTGWEKKAELETGNRMSRLASAENRVANWPPVLGQRFPHVDLFDHTGNKFSFESLAGKPTVIEFIAMSCAGCQAFAGGNKYGGFEGFATQSNLQSFESYFEQYTGYHLSSADINFVQIVFYDLQLESPSPAELAAWRKHFRLDRQANSFVLSGGKALANKISFAMIPGFMLLDTEQVVQYDSTGHQPQHDLYSQLLPAAKNMLDDRAR